MTKNITALAAALSIAFAFGNIAKAETPSNPQDDAFVSCLESKGIETPKAGEVETMSCLEQDVAEEHTASPANPFDRAFALCLDANGIKAPKAGNPATEACLEQAFAKGETQAEVEAKSAVMRLLADRALLAAL